MGTFYSRLSYSIGNEDWKTEEKALNPNPGKRYLCVTASGDRPLNLAYHGCEIVSVDANPVQNALLELKKIAMAELSFEEYLGFLGACDHTSRLKTYQRIQHALSQEAKSIWEAYSSKIQKGILYQGTVEKITQFASSFITVLRGKRTSALFGAKCLDEQKEIVASLWDTPTWRKSVEVILNPVFTRFFIKDPGLYAHVDPSIHVGKHIYNRMTSALMNFPVRESIILSLIFQGKVFEEGFSPYLQEKGFKKIKSHLNNITCHTEDVVSFLEKCPDNSFDGFSLSDVASYMSCESFTRLAKAIVRTARPQARFCIRQFLSRYQLPSEVSPHFSRNMALEKTLENEDRCFIYQFLVGNIVKNP